MFAVFGLISLLFTIAFWAVKIMFALIILVFRIIILVITLLFALIGSLFGRKYGSRYRG